MKLKDKGNEALQRHASSVHHPHAEGIPANLAANHNQIRRRAHEIYLELGAIAGRELDDWLQAERELENTQFSIGARICAGGWNSVGSIVLGHETKPNGARDRERR
jgi:hypothetical protein